MFTKNKFVLAITLATIIFAASASAQVTNTYVAGTTGNDANPCTAAQPCATVNRAITAVDPNGKVLIIESGDYAQFAFFKPLTVAAADGVNATINATIGFAIFNNNLQPDDVVTIRNLNLVAQAPNLNGIAHFHGGTMFIEKCSFYGFESGMNINGKSRTYISDTTFRKNLYGLTAAGPAPNLDGLARVTLDSNTFEANETGIYAIGRILMNVRNSTFSGQTSKALWIRSSTANHMAEVILDTCQINHNATGILVNGFNGGIGAVSLSRSTITRNNLAGISMQGTGYAYSAGNNTFFGNNPDVSGGNLQVQQQK